MKQITLGEYQLRAVRTLAVLEDHTEDEFHMCLGMMTEIGEIGDIFKRKFAYKKDIDIVNLKEEVGDLCWYLANYSTIRSEIPFEFIDMDFEDEEKDVVKNSLSCILAINGCIEDVIDYTMFGEGAFFEGDSKEIISVTLSFVKKLCEINKIDIFECMYLNIEKLQKRFPDKFNEEHALNRNLESERETLEQE